MYITRRRNPIKKNLAKEKLKNHLTNKTCPKCSGHMELVESKKDSDVYICSKCNATNTFNQLSSYVKEKSKEVQLGVIKLVDKSKEKQYDYRQRVTKESQEVAPIMLDTIRKAMTEKKLLQFDYPKDKTVATRTVEPYKLGIDGSKNIMLWAYCVEAEGIRVFKLNKMQNIEMKEFTYSPRWDVEDKLGEKGNDENKGTV